MSKKREKLNFLLVGITLFLRMGVNIVCTSLLVGKHDWSIRNPDQS